MSPDRKTYLAPSILSADFAKIEDAISLIENAGGDFVHMDVMDGVFVPNLTFGDKMVMDVRRLTKLPLDVHLMVANPESHIPRFLDAGADYLTFHFEATVHVHRALQSIKDAGKKAGISIVPSTPVNFLSEILDMVDLVLIMSVNPGFGGQKLIYTCLEKVKRLQFLREKYGYSYLISLDGGIGPDTAQDVRNAGTDIFVCGSSFFLSPDPIAAAMEIMGNK